MDQKEYLSLREESLNWVRGRLKDSRFAHTLGVEESAVHLASKYGVDVQEASLAAILHDNAKYLPYDRQQYLCRMNFPNIDFSLQYRSIFHAFAGSVEAHQMYPDLSQNLLNAIAYHTTGRPGMTDLEMVIYCADYVEPNRPDFPGLSDARKALESSLYEGFIMILSNTCRYVEQQKKPVHPLSLQTLAYYQKKQPGTRKN